MTGKKYYAKVYERTSSRTMTLWTDIKIEGFSKTINGGLGEIEIQLARSFDNYGEGEDIKLNNKVMIYVSGPALPPEGKLIYTGYISQINPYVDGHSEGVNIRCLGYISKFAVIPFISSTTNPTKTYDSQEISGIVGDILAVTQETTIGFKRNDPNFVCNYTGSTISNTGVNATIRFPLKSLKEAMDICLDYSAVSATETNPFYYYLDANETFYFRRKPGKATHTFYFKKHVKKISVEKSMTEMRNYYYYWNGLQESDANKVAIFLTPSVASQNIDLYGLRWEVLEGRINDDTTDGQAFGTKAIYRALSNNAVPILKADIEIADIGTDAKSGYVIENIEPGDTCKILNLPDTVNSIFNNNMTITKVDYSLGKVNIELTLQEDLSKRIVDKENLQSQLNQVQLPSTFTEVS